MAEDDFKMQAVASACLSNISAERAYKDLVVQVCTDCVRARLPKIICLAHSLTRRSVLQSPAIQSLEQVLSSPDIAAATEAAGAFWSLCVQNTVRVHRLIEDAPDLSQMLSL